jgi:hypothetical protein
VGVFLLELPSRHRPLQSRRKETNLEFFRREFPLPVYPSGSFIKRFLEIP